MQGWDVYLDGKHMTVAYYTRDCDAEYVKTTLINHDGYPPHVIVQKRK